MKLTAKQLRRIIKEEVATARRTRLTEALTPEVLAETKSRVLDNLQDAILDLSYIAESTDDPDAQSAVMDLESLMKLIEGITGTPGTP